MGLIQTDVLPIGKRAFEIARAGAGDPTVVLINGSGGHLDSWFRIYDKLSESGSVFAYNRPGIGKSSASDDDRVVSICATDLIRVLECGGLAPPWILVGHSFGGMIANYLARKEPDSVAAVAFLDATAPADIETAAQTSAVPGFYGWLSLRFLPKKQHSEVVNSLRSRAEIEQAGAFPVIPVTVISGAKSAKGWTVPHSFRESRQHNQKGLAALSPIGIQLIAQKSGHFPQINEPSLVIEAIADLRAVVRKTLAA